MEKRLKKKTKSEVAELMTKEEVDAIDITIEKADKPLTRDVHKEVKSISVKFFFVS
ncbi:hypothetical protein [Peribacillus frigoritolerans]|uniref:hypothetical protein n=1 Tax=Peribacillus frigoritolerans TaxID=450367 RepID=UPI0020798C0E|nr:hypothetical protein [Peribacillus frigoritolerans]USK76736.1 hypothetical protein LIT31_09415 [Peribacillus frigoritolerans]